MTEYHEKVLKEIKRHSNQQFLASQYQHASQLAQREAQRRRDSEIINIQKVLIGFTILLLFITIAFAIMLKRSARKSKLAADQKSLLLANVSHEVRTPLNAIIGFSEMLEGEIFGPVGSEKNK